MGIFHLKLFVKIENPIAIYQHERWFLIVRL